MPEWTCLSLKYLGKVHIVLGGYHLQSSYHSSTLSLAESLNSTCKYGDYWIHFEFFKF
jgi:cysteinyl-tRNA synthetase